MCLLRHKKTLATFKEESLSRKNCQQAKNSKIRVVKSYVRKYYVFRSFLLETRHTGLALVNQNVYWPAKGNLVCIVAYHWSKVFIRNEKNLNACIKIKNHQLYLCVFLE